MRTIISGEPFPGKSDAYNERGIWPAGWIGDSKVHGQEAAVTAFRRIFSLERQTQVRIHVSADERYELFLDGHRIGRGPERGDPQNWFYETYDLDLPPGPHALVARTWWIGPHAGAPFSQMSVRPGFLLAAEGALHNVLSTGAAPWESKRLPGYEFLPVDQRIRWVGAKLAVHGDLLDWDVENGKTDGWESARINGLARDQPEMDYPDGSWKPAEIAGQAQDASTSNCTPLIWRLRPALLPPMFEQDIHVGIARHVQVVDSLETLRVPVMTANHMSAEAMAWNKLLSGQSTVTIQPHTSRRVIVDLDNYYCAYPQLVTTGGAGAMIRLHWAEALFEPSDTQAGYRDQQGHLFFPPKGNRDQIEGKLFNGVGDTFKPDGGSNRHFHTLWWEAGRYLEFVISTADQPLTLERFWLIETHYPYQRKHHFESSDPRLAAVIPLALRTLDMCSHETYMDCPYYEQLMYLGDTRLQVLATYATCNDDRLPRKAIEVFDFSRRIDGLTQSRYPSRIMQVIPPFSLWWVAMIHDYAMWRDDRQFVADRMSGVRGVMDHFRSMLNQDDLLQAPQGWNFTDWVPGWADGVPPGAYSGVSGLLNFQLVWVLRQAAELETWLNEPELAARNIRHANAIAKAASTAFWDERRGLFSDDLAHQHFSEHTQCLALLADSVPATLRDRVVQGLLNDVSMTHTPVLRYSEEPGRASKNPALRSTSEPASPEDSPLARATIYFMHYLFEAYRLLGQPQRIIDRMSLWFDLKGNGLRTTVEMPEPCRSDCHAWGAHPVYHYFATILGIRPGAPGFSHVRIDPQLGPLDWVRGTMPHPRGHIRADLAIRDGQLTGNIDLPDGVTGTLVHDGKNRELMSGTNRLS